MTNSTAIVFQGLPRMDHPYASAAMTLAKELSKSHKVYYVEHPLTYKDAMKPSNFGKVKSRFSIWKKELPIVRPYRELPDFQVIVPSPVTPVNFLPEGSFYQSSNDQVRQGLWEKIEQYLVIEGVSEFIYINSFDPTLWPKKFNLKPLQTIYHCVDWIGGERYIARHGVSAEKEAMQQADLVICTSEELAQKAASYSKQVQVVKNGVWSAHFERPAPLPPDLAEIRQPRLLYAGNIGLRLDYPFLEKAALSNPEWQYVFAGPINQREFKGEVLRKLHNVHFLGSRSAEQIPAYMQHADICLLPFEANELTACIYPLKLNEYLAAGKPVLSSRFAKLPEFEEAVNWYSDLDSFEQQVRKCLSHHSEEKRETGKALARNNDWSARVKEFTRFFGSQKITNSTNKNTYENAR